MCGITGVLQLDRKPVSARLVDQMTIPAAKVAGPKPAAPVPFAKPRPKGLPGKAKPKAKAKTGKGKTTAKSPASTQDDE